MHKYYTPAGTKTKNTHHLLLSLDTEGKKGRLNLRFAMKVYLFLKMQPEHTAIFDGGNNMPAFPPDVLVNPSQLLSQTVPFLVCSNHPQKCHFFGCCTEVVPTENPDLIGGIYLHVL